MVVTMAEVEMNINACNVNISGISHNNISESCDLTMAHNNRSPIPPSKDIGQCDGKDSISCAMSSSDVTGSHVEDDDVDAKCPDIPIPEGPLDPRTLMDLKFIKHILDNLVTPRETRVVLELVVEFIKQETGQSLQGQLDSLKDFGGKLSTIDNRHEQLKSSVSKYKEKVASLQRKVGENQTKLKLISKAN